MKNAFTMIEMVFVIVIIGILSVVVIPKLSAHSDDATAKICETNAVTLLDELLYYYSKNGYFDTLKNISNQETGVSGVGNNGIAEAGTVVPSSAGPVTVTYVCNGEAIVTYTPAQSSYKDAQGIVHSQFGIITSDPGSQSTVAAKIAVSDFTSKGFYKVSPGYTVGGN